MNANRLVLRRARGEDAADVAALWHDSWHATHAPYSDPDVVAWRRFDWFLGRAVGIVKSAYVAERGQRTVAFVAWDHDKLGQLFVDHTEYGRGAADLLLKAAELAMAGNGVTQAYLYCRTTNARALHFYQKRGWVKDGEIVEQLICATGTRPSAVWRLGKSLP